MTGEATVEVGTARGEGLRIELLGRAHPGGLGVFDDNWLLAHVRVQDAARSFRFDAFLRAHDFAAFDAELRALAAGCAATATFWPRDPWVGIRVQSSAPDGGGARVAVYARDGGSERAAELDLALDAEALRALCAAVAAAARAFPIER